MMQKQCPFSGMLPAAAAHRKTASSTLSLSELAKQISKHGMGPESRMLSESLVATEMKNPNLPEIHAAEGAKFAAIADKVAPAALVAETIQKYIAVYPPVTLLEARHICKSFHMILQATDNGISQPQPAKAQFFRYAQSDSKNYFAFCAKEPDLYLAGFYLTLALQNYVRDLETHVPNKNVGFNLLNFGKQFDSSNLVAWLPLAISISLFKQHGPEAKSSQVNQNIIFDALMFLHKEEQFSVIGKGMRGTSNEGTQATLTCPMQGYLFNLLGRYEVLQPMIAAIDRANNAIKHPEQRHPNSKALLAIHETNSKSVSKIAGEFLQNFNVRV